MVRLLSVETELPAINIDDSDPVLPKVFQAFWDGLESDGWNHDGFGVSRVLEGNSDCIKAGQMMTTDTGPTLELSPSPSPAVQQVESELKSIRSLAVKRLADNHGVALLGSGVHPTLGVSNKEYLRYRTPRKPYDYAIEERGWEHRSVLNIAATQEIVDLHFDETIRVFRVMQRLSGPIMFLCRNDPDYHATAGHRLSIRPDAWKWHVPNVGRFASDRHMVWLPSTEVTNWHQYLKLLWDMNPMFMLGTKSDGLVYIPEHPTFLEFISHPHQPKDGWRARKIADGETCSIKPSMEHVSQTDWTYMGLARLRWKWTDESASKLSELISMYNGSSEEALEDFLRDNLAKVVIENRSVATPVPGQEMASLALVLGLITNLDAFENRVFERPYAFWLAMAHAAEYQPLDSKVAGVKVLGVVKDLLDLANEGLKSRGFGEEKYLEPLYERVDNKLSLSERMLQLFNQRGIDGIIEELIY